MLLDNDCKTLALQASKDASTDSVDPSRRRFLAAGAAIVATVPVAMLAGSRVSFAMTPMVDPASDAAVRLKYIEDTELEGKNCESCALYQPVAGNDKGGNCPLFQGSLVGKNAWCSAYAPKA
jgi:hypothetical protein